ncbi:MAG: dimethyl sulfoxide reductase anchor subunit [Alphaproteobacteria bacterium]|nr:dimethyl sulfoxide reductase anchor subunit [Alphaproteobacteria bacterium]
MNPAYSVIFFTTASGAGYGLLALTAFAASSHGPASSLGFALACIVLSLVLITAGLLSSTAHLGRPERAWRAFSQWRSSWLSREGIVAVVTYPVALAFGLVWSGLVDMPALIRPLGLLTAAMCALTVFCTAMIYRQLTTIPAWANRFAVPGYLLFGLATGAGLLSLLSVVFGRFQAGAGPFQVVLTMILIVAVMALKWFYWRWLEMRPTQFTMAEATGLGDGVRQWEVPHTARNFIMKEMGFQVARAHAQRLQRICLLLLAVALVSMLASLLLPWSVAIAAITLLLAAWTERWLFFAQAEHVSALYYGKTEI